MKHLKNTVFSLAILLMAAPLSGCESMDGAMTDVKQRFSEIKMPEITPRSDAESYVEGDRSADLGTVRPERSDSFKEAAFSDSESDPARKETVVVAGSGNCPPVNMVDELKSFHQFPDPEHPSPESKLSAITLTGLKTECSFKGENVIIDIDLAMVGELGDGARRWSTDRYSFAYPYFVALTAPSGNVIAKEVFAASVTFPKNGNVVEHTEHLRHVIPINGDYDTDHQLMIGFQLTDAELAYNRSLLSAAATAQVQTPVSMTPDAAASAAAVVPSPEDTLTPAPKKAEAKPKKQAEVKPARKPDAIAADTPQPEAEPVKQEAAAAPAAAPVETVVEEEVVIDKPTPAIDQVSPAAGGETAREPITEFDPITPMVEEAAELQDAIEEITPAPAVEQPAATTLAPAPEPAAEQTPAQRKILPPVPVKEEVTPDVAPDAVYIPTDPDPSVAIDITAD